MCECVCVFACVCVCVCCVCVCVCVCVCMCVYVYIGPLRYAHVQGSRDVAHGVFVLYAYFVSVTVFLVRDVARVCMTRPCKLLID